MTDRPVGAVAAVMHDTTDLEGAVAFWTTLLGLDVVHNDGRFAYLSPLSAGGPHLAFQSVPEPRQGKNRLHLDIKVPDRAQFTALVADLGGSEIEEHQLPGFPVWTVMADPQGNEFCIYDKEDAAA